MTRGSRWLLASAALAGACAWLWARHDWSRLDVFGTQNLVVFIGTGILLNLTPGQDTMYILGRTVAQGRRAGVLSVFGITSGTLVHTTAAALGLSAILATSARAFTIVKLAGALYLMYLGARMLLQRTSDSDARSHEFGRDSAWTIYRSAVLTNLLNPKVALFFLAFLPQFVARTSDSRVIAFFFLGAIFMTTGTIWCLVLAWFGSIVGARLRRQRSLRFALERAAGVLFIGMGAKVATSR